MNSVPCQWFISLCRSIQAQMLLGSSGEWPGVAFTPGPLQSLQRRYKDRVKDIRFKVVLSGTIVPPPTPFFQFSGFCAIWFPGPYTCPEFNFWEQCFPKSGKITLSAYKNYFPYPISSDSGPKVLDSNTRPNWERRSKTNLRPSTFRQIQDFPSLC